MWVNLILALGQATWIHCFNFLFPQSPFYKQLSDVAQGGGTAFPVLKQLLKPQKYAGTWHASKVGREALDLY